MYAFVFVGELLLLCVVFQMNHVSVIEWVSTTAFVCLRIFCWLFLVLLWVLSSKNA